MTYEEIETVLKNAGFNSIIERLRVAVGEEADALTDSGHAVGRVVSQMIAEARTYYAEAITSWLDSSDYPVPEVLLDRRARYMNSWAFAQIIAKLQVDENDEDEGVPIDDNALLRICDANSQLGLHLVEVMRENRSLAAAVIHSATVQRIREALDAASIDNMNLLGNRKLEEWERVEILLVELTEARAQLVDIKEVASVVHQTSGDAATAIALDLQKTVENLIWTAKTIHEAHHRRPGERLCNWRECDKGTCVSMDHMLAQVGLNKQLEPIEREP